MRSRTLLLSLLFLAQSAQALQFPCQNPSGRARADSLAVVTRELFLGEPMIVVHFPGKAEGRDFFYSMLAVGNPRTGQAIVEARPYQRAYGASKDWYAIDVQHVSKKLPLVLNIYYGANPKCRTTVKVQIQ